ncbi:hypothetical protein QYF36_018039 [Acer negundo]|nr:hypothetical protein QYF36_018039 [Acer negundo]
MDKIHKKYLLPSYIPTLLFSPLYIIFFHHLSVPVAGDSPHVYNPTETIFLYCGSSKNISSLDPTRTWIGDINSEHFPLHQSENNASTTAEPSQQPRDDVDKTPYMSARLSRFQFSYTFNLTPGQKFIRLYFYETSYPNLDRSKAFFSVKAGSFTLLSNFSTSLAANDSHQDTILKEFCVNVPENQNLNITFSPSQEYKDSYAFINGIEIVSMPPDLYYTTATGGKEFPFVGQASGALFSLSNSNALEMVYRVNVGGRPIPAANDTGMYRTWSDDVSYLTEAYPSALPVNLTLQPKFRSIHNYSAPVEVYQTARTMGNDAKVNENYKLTWEFPVDSAFTYLVRLHFCEFQPEITETGNRIFEIHIANQPAEKRADVIAWGGGNGFPVYRDYAVMMGSKANQKKQNLSIALHPAPAYMTNYSDAILNGVEIFKVDNSRSLAGPNPDPPTTPTTVKQTTSVGPTSTTSKAHVSTAVKGSFGYLDPEYIRFQRLTEKSDVYSFGVVLCEVICARAPIIRTVDKIHKKQGNLAGWALQCYDQNGTLDQIIDPVLKGKIAPQCLKKFCEVVMSCLDNEGIKRPPMSDVVWGLEFALQLQQEYEKLGICVSQLDDDDDDDETLINNYASDYDSGGMFSRIGGHVLESRSMSKMTISSSDDYGFSSKDSDSKPILV